MPVSKHRKKYYEKRRTRRLEARGEQKRRGDENPSFRTVMNKLNGWQRKKWAGAGYLGLRLKDAEQVRPFTLLERPRGL